MALYSKLCSIWQFELQNPDYWNSTIEITSTGSVELHIPSVLTVEKKDFRSHLVQWCVKNSVLQKPWKQVTAKPVQWVRLLFQGAFILFADVCIFSSLVVFMRSNCNPFQSRILNLHKFSKQSKKFYFLSRQYTMYNVLPYLVGYKFVIGNSWNISWSAQRKFLTLFQLGRDPFVTETVYHVTKPSWNRVKGKVIK